MNANTQVWKDTLDGESHRGQDLKNQRFGELVVVRAVDRSRKGILWLCRCDCGRVALRSTSALRRSVKLGHTPTCLRCFSELRRGLFLQRTVDRAGFWLKAWLETGSLYSADWSDREKDRIVDEVVEGGLPRPEEIPTLPLFLEEGADVTPCGGQRAAYLAPIRSDEGWVWRCYECGSTFDNGFTCLACECAVCCGCISGEDHSCHESTRRDWERVMQPKNLDPILLQQFPGGVMSISEEERVARRKTRLMQMVREIEGEVGRKKRQREQYRNAVIRARQKASAKEKREHFARMRKRFPSLAAVLKNMEAR